MARIRSIKPAFFTSDDICRCSLPARLLFLGLLTESDRRGRIEDRPPQLKRRLLPDDACDVDDLLWELADAGLVRRYEDSGLRIIQIVNFEKHQHPHPKEAESTLPNDGIDRKPFLSTASPEKVSVLPVEHEAQGYRVPACTGTGMGNGSGDLGSGVPPATRQPVQCSGAFEPGTLPRDHVKHVICGPRRLICLSYPQFDKLAPRYNGTDAAETRAGLEAFVSSVEAGIGPQQSAGDYLWLLKHFDAWLIQQGRVTAAPSGKPRTRTAAEVIASMEKKGML